MTCASNKYAASFLEDLSKHHNQVTTTLRILHKSFKEEISNAEVIRLVGIMGKVNRAHGTLKQAAEAFGCKPSKKQRTRR